MGSFGVDKAVVYRYELGKGAAWETRELGDFSVGLSLGKCTNWDPGAWASASCAQVPEEH